MVTTSEHPIPTLGEPTHHSPLTNTDFIDDSQRVRLEISCGSSEAGFERAGPRSKLFFNPREVRAGLVTCGGLCPGLNNVVRSIVFELRHRYGVREVQGFQYGFEGLNLAMGLPPVSLTLESVADIHRTGGSVLGVSRGKQPAEAMIRTLLTHGINMLFVIGGDGSLRGAAAISQQLRAVGAPVAVVGIPKTIDNDVCWVDKTFGFDTAVEVARGVIEGAHSEATSARNGVSLVKLMGRDAGFLAATAVVASGEANFCLVPEVPFDLHGEGGFLHSLAERTVDRGHAVIVVAEGCAAALSGGEEPRDASGNISYSSGGLDVGPTLREEISKYFAANKIKISLKYMDPSYQVRSVPVIASDGLFCDQLARNAVHAAMAGKTDIMVGRWHRVFTHVPLSMAITRKNSIDPRGELWHAVMECTGQGPLRNQSGPEPVVTRLK